MRLLADRRWFRALWWIAAAGLVLRLVWLASVPKVIENEGVDYVRLAESLKQGGYIGILGGPQVLFPPLYPILIALVSFLTRNGELAARLISVFMGVALIFPLSLVVKRIAGEGTALIAAMLVAAHPVMIALSAAVLSESCYFALLFGALWATSEVYERHGYVHAALAGVLFGLAYLTRPEALFLAFAATALSLCWLFYQRRYWTFALTVSGTMTAACIVLAAPYVAYLSKNSGYLRLEGKSAFITLINTRMSEGLSYDEASFQISSDRLLDWPMVSDGFGIPRPEWKATVKPLITGIRYRVRRCALALLTTRFFGWPALITLGLAGVVGYWRWSFHHCLVSIACGWTLVSLLSVWFLFPRYLFAVLPFFLLAAALGIWRIASACARVAARWAPRLPVYETICGLLLAASIVPAAGPTLRIADIAGSRKIFYKEAGTWIAQHHGLAGQKLRIMGIGSPTPFYAGGVLVYLPYADSTSAIHYVESQRPAFIVLHPDEKTSRPYIAEWLAHGIPHPCAQLLKRFPVRNYRDAAVVYRWNCADRALLSAEKSPN